LISCLNKKSEDFEKDLIESENNYLENDNDNDNENYKLKKLLK
jgi:hypothetical protein